jgi:hypothetical protein
VIECRKCKTALRCCRIQGSDQTAADIGSITSPIRHLEQGLVETTRLDAVVYIPGCDLIIAQHDEAEAQLCALFSERAPVLVANDYLENSERGIEISARIR